MRVLGCRYGFHGTSYKYLTQKAASMLGKPESEVNLVICHLGESLLLHDCYKCCQRVHIVQFHLEKS